jgi:hypothetical protein
VAVAVLVAALVTWLVWPSSSAPQFTWKGRTIADASGVLSKAENTVGAYVSNRHGAKNDSTRCYFVQPDKAASGTKRTDVEDHLLCGPVLFVDGNKSKPYLALPLSATGTSGGKQQLSTPGSLSGLQPDAVPAGVKLARPDKKSAPSGAGGLDVPAPPPADKDALLAVSLGPTAAPAAIDNAVLIGRDSGVRLIAAGEISRYGSGDDARSAPQGYHLIAFQTAAHDGDLDGHGTSTPQVVVGGQPRPLPATSAGSPWVVVAVASGTTAELSLTDAGVTQTLSLPGGQPGSGNIQVLARTHRDVQVNRKINVPVRLTLHGSTVQTYSWHVTAAEARLFYWSDANPDAHASDPAHALLYVDITYTDPGLTTPNEVFGFHSAMLSMTLPDGTVIQSHDIDKKNGFVINVFDVPADFTTGVVHVSGRDTLADDYIETVAKPGNIPISIPAG